MAFADELLQSDRFKGLAPEVQHKVVDRFFESRIVDHPKIQQLDDQTRRQALGRLRATLDDTVAKGLGYKDLDTWNNAGGVPMAAKSPEELYTGAPDQPLVSDTTMLAGGLATGMRPLSAAASFATAPIAHQYKAQDASGQLWEALAVGAKAAKADLLPSSERPDYEGQVVENYFPNMPEQLKPTASTLLGFLGDPASIVFPFKKGFQEGLAIAARTGTELNPFSRALAEMVSYVPMRDEEYHHLAGLAKLADGGDKAAADILVNSDVVKPPNLGEHVKAITPEGKVVEAAKSSSPAVMPQKDFNANYLTASSAEKSIHEDLQKAYFEPEVKEAKAAKAVGEVTPEVTPEVAAEVTTPDPMVIEPWAGSAGPVMVEPVESYGKNISKGIDNTFTEGSQKSLSGKYTKKLNTVHEEFQSLSEDYLRMQKDPSIKPKELDSMIFGDLEITLEDLKDRRVLSSEDVNNVLDGLKTGTYKRMLLNPDKDFLSRVMEGLNISGMTESEKAFKGLKSQGGYISPVIMKDLGINSIGALTGFDVDENGVPRWKFENWVHRGGAALSALTIGRHFYRKIGAADQIRKVGSNFSERFWKALSEPARTETGQVIKTSARKIAESFHPTERAVKEAYALKRQFYRQKANIRRAADKFAMDVATKFSPEERALISDIIEQEGDWEKASKHLFAQADEIVGFHKQIRQMLIDSGLAEEEVNKLGDKYLHRVYAPRMNKRPYQYLRAKIKAISVKYLKNRGIVRSLKPEQFKELGINLDQLAKDDKVVSFRDSDLRRRRFALAVDRGKIRELSMGGEFEPFDWRVESTENGVLKLRRDYTRTEREAMGESRDVALRMAVLNREASHDIALGRMFQNIKENPGWTVKSDVLAKNESLRALEKRMQAWGWVKVPLTETHKGIKKYGALSGHYVHPDVMKVLGSMTSGRLQNDVLAGLDKLNQALLKPWKIGKTAFSPATHGINVLTNFHISVMDGREPTSLAIRGAQSIRNNDKWFQEAINEGLIDSGIMQADWDINSFINTAKKIKDQENPGGLLKAFGNLFTKPARGAMKLYEKEDQIFKMGVYISEREKGAEPQEALEAANKLFFDYSDVPRGIQFLRRTGLVPFVSWTYKIIPVIANTMVDNPHRILALIAGYKALGDYHYEHEYKDKAEAQRAYEHSLMPDWQKKSFYGLGPSTSVRLANADDGQARFLDASRFLPGADLFQDMANGFPFGFHPLIATVFTLASGKTASFKRELYPYDNPVTSEQKSLNAKSLVNYLANQWAPNLPFINPYSYSTNNLGNALVANGTISKDVGNELGWTGKDWTGHDVSLAETMLGLFGPKIRRLDTDASLQSRVGIIRSKTKDAGMDVFKTMIDPRKTPAEKEQMIQNAIETGQYSADEIQKLYKLKQATQ